MRESPFPFHRWMSTWYPSEHYPGRLNPEPHLNSLIYNDGSANSPPSPYAEQAQIGSDGYKLENRDILSDFSESRCVLARLAPAKPPVKRWQAPIGSPFTLSGDCWAGFQAYGLLLVGLDIKTPSLQMELKRGSLPPTQDIFWERSFFGKFYKFSATRIRKIYDFPKCRQASFAYTL